MVSRFYRSTLQSLSLNCSRDLQGRHQRDPEGLSSKTTTVYAKPTGYRYVVAIWMHGKVTKASCPTKSRRVMFALNAWITVITLGPYRSDCSCLCARHAQSGSSTNLQKDGPKWMLGTEKMHGNIGNEKMIENESAIQTTDLPSVCERQPLRILALLIYCLHYFLGRLTKIVLQSVQPWRFCGSGPWQSKTTRKARQQRSMKDNWALTSHSFWKLGPFWHIATVGS